MTVVENPMSPQISTAPSPFDKPTSDIILRTSDAVDFHVFSQVLIAASPVFEGMFEFPQPPLEQQKLKIGRPIVEVTETSAALETLLRICYPINKPKEWSLDDIEPALRAAIKYEMELPTTVLTENLERLAVAAPLQVWAVACRLGLEPLARHAAYNVPSSPLAVELLGQMHGISAGNYFRLRKFHRLQGKVPSDFLFLSPSGSTAAPPRGGPKPFDHRLDIPQDPVPDLVCRSGDGKEFHVHATVLSLASPVLKEKIAGLPSPEEGAPLTLVLQSHSAVVGKVLEAIYGLDPEDDDGGSEPASPPVLPSHPSDVMPLLLVAEEFELRALSAKLRSAWRGTAAFYPLVAYYVAIRAARAECAREAAKYVLHISIEGIYNPEMEYIPALSYHRLLALHDECSRKSRDKIKSISQMIEPSQNLEAEQAVAERPSDSCGMPVTEAANATHDKPRKKGRKIKRTLSWLQSHLAEMLAQLPMSGPCSSRYSPSVEELFLKATTSSPDTVWCCECQEIAQNIIVVHNELRVLTASLAQRALEITI